MKIRVGFVTNSSSSSFLIQRSIERFLDIQSIYEFIRSRYINRYKKIQNVLEIGIQYKLLDAGDLDTNDLRELAAKKIYKLYMDRDKSIDRKLYNKLESFNTKAQVLYGISIYDIDMTIPEWVETCITYEDYEKFFLNNGGRMPFYILDHNELTEYNDDVREALAWYDYETARNIPYDRESKQVVEQMKSAILKFGEFGVYGDSSTIPYYIANSLMVVSKVGCGHMG